MMKNTHDTSLISPADLLVAGALLTRLPLPRAADAAFQRQAEATWAYGAVGLLVGVIGALVWGLAEISGLPPLICAGLSLAAVALSTGALHEDGLSDTADGLWGGHDPARRLEIMKDSRIGSYGVLALVFVTGLRWCALSLAGPLALIAAASVTRGVLPGMMAFLPNARGSGLAQHVGQPSPKTTLLAIALAGLIAVLAVGLFHALITLFVAVLIACGIGWIARKKIGGITGDVLGATQQVAEAAILIALIT